MTKEVKMFNGNMLAVGDEVDFWDTWDAKGSGGDDDEILDSGSTWVANEDNDIPICAEFEILERDYEVPGKSRIKITGFF